MSDTNVPGLLSETSTDEEIIKYINALIIEMESYRDKMKSATTTTSWKQEISNRLQKEFEQLTILTVERNNKDIKDRLTDISQLVDEFRRVVGTASDGAIALQLLLSDTTFKKIQDIEKQIMYRRFYFPGGVPELIVVNENDLAAYDNWDPRIYKEYIMMAHQRGFHRYFIIYDSTNNNYRTTHFSEADTTLNMHIDWLLGTWVAGSSDTSDTIKFKCADMLAGLIYFDKLDTFLKEFEILHTKKSITNIRTNLYDLIQSRIKKIQTFIGQSEKNFKLDNIGWTSYADNSFAFDSAELLPEWIALQDKYEEFQNKVFEILSNVEALQLCTNYNYAFGNNIYLNQTVECMQTVIKNETHVEVHEGIVMGDEEEEEIAEEPPVQEPQDTTETSTEEQDSPKTDTEEPPAQTPEEEEEDESNIPAATTPTYNPDVQTPSSDQTPNTQTPPTETPDTQTPSTETPEAQTPPTETPAVPEEPFYKQTWFIIVCVIVVLSFTALIIFVSTRSSRKRIVQRVQPRTNPVQPQYV